MCTLCCNRAVSKFIKKELHKNWDCAIQSNNTKEYTKNYFTPIYLMQFMFMVVAFVQNMLIQFHTQLILIPYQPFHKKMRKTAILTVPCDHHHHRWIQLAQLLFQRSARTTNRSTDQPTGSRGMQWKRFKPYHMCVMYGDWVTDSRTVSQINRNGKINLYLSTYIQDLMGLWEYVPLDWTD